jgi:hypothetical protein
MAVFKKQLDGDETQIVKKYGRTWVTHPEDHHQNERNTR